MVGWKLIERLLAITDEVILKYPPEQLTRIRRALVEWRLLIPDKTVQKKRMEIAESWKHDKGTLEQQRIQATILKYQSKK